MPPSTDTLRAESHTEIGAIIEQQAGILVELWSRRAIEEQLSARRVHAAVLRDHLMQFLQQMGRAVRLEGSSDRGASAHIAREHGEQRWDSGWSIGEVVRDYQILQVVILEYLEQALDRALRIREVMSIGVFVNDAIAASINSYVASRDAVLAEGEQARSRALLEANQRKDEFLAMLGHELRNPLDPIQTAAAVLRLQLERAGEALSRPLEVIDRQCKHLVRLVDDLLDLARIGQGRFELRPARFDLVALIREAVSSRERLILERRHQLSLECPDSAIEIDADPDRILQVVANLVTNAAKYTVARGHIRLAVRREQSEAVIEVGDDGIGIPPEMLGRIFDAFTRAADADDGYGGLGVGLTLVRRLVEQHGGKVVVRSDGIGKGATFSVRLPLPKSASPAVDMTIPTP